MTEIMTAVPAAPRGEGMLAFVQEARGRLDSGIALPAAALLVVLTASNIGLLLDLPAPGERPGPVLLAAGLARVVGLFFFSVPILRVMAGSERRPWELDGAFFLFYPVAMFSLGVAAVLALLFTDPANPADALRIVLRTGAATAIMAPLAPWLVGIAAAVPLGINPARFLIRFRRWLPHLLFWLLLLVTPLAALHAMIDMALVQGRIGWFWSAALLDGALSTLVVIATYAFHAAAYRRVAQG